jgi:hypothetical protein
MVKHSKEYNRLFFGTIAIWSVIIGSALIIIIYLSLVHPIPPQCTDIYQRNDTTVTFTFDNRHENILPDVWCHNLTVVCNSIYYVPDNTEYASLSFNKTYTCQITKHTPRYFFVTNESISNCSETARLL